MKTIFPITLFVAMILLSGCNQGGTDDLPFTEPPTKSQELTFNECTSQPEICTEEYKPVCGLIDNGVRCITAPCASTDAEEFSNGCFSCSAGAQGYYDTTCSDVRFVVCGETVTGFSSEQYAKDVGGVCVDICPGNYDSFTTQTGIEECISHYGEEEIAGWETCERSSDSCNCVNAYETTEGQQIENPEYRCVPENYAERMIFRGGLDRLDENGERSVAIA